ncbi:hypothetical protein GOARA_048_01170 [Gordonia araii NBRC 100433]|uniref:DUF3298 domain-containing protein n=1 Tax=Gordonia araii NBRC 100433 TaxID=1073574 RepID=G7H240_9ACTN|nr:hypothetical protein [Gordonia araii]NNG97248.1 hypothetical protein [Gordonia araii NBRC 100433]GAB09915.1 hypothetical protein GOARA_048_01170 [Gordonia araii NBRC 100433]
MHRAPRIHAGIVALAVATLGLTGCAADEAPTQRTETTADDAEPTPLGFIPITDRRTGHLDDGTNWTVMLPQVQGGDPQVRAAFNGELDAILVKLTGQPSGNGLTIGDGGLGTAERSRAIVGARTVSGVVIVLSNAKGAAHPNVNVETVVVDGRTGEVIDEPFEDAERARGVLSGLAAAHDPTGRLRDGATSSDFTSWIPLPEGLHVYVSVPHVMGDYVPVTIPWNKVSGLLSADARQVLVG